MAVADTKPFRRGDRINADDLNDIIALANRGATVIAGHDALVSSSPYGAGVMALPGEDFSSTGMPLFSVSFIGQIVRHGPDGQEDFEDARYWVRELLEVSDGSGEVTDRPEFLREVEGIGDDPKRFRWVPAVNLSEFNQATPEEEGHELGIPEDGSDDDGAIVTVHRVQSAAGDTHYAFFGGSGGTSNRLAVVLSILEPSGRFLSIMEILPDPAGETWNGLWIYSGVEQTVSVWPATIAEDYARHVRPGPPPDAGDQVTDDTTPIELRRVAGVWVVSQDLKYQVPAVRTQFRHSDCQLTGDPV